MSYTYLQLQDEVLAFQFAEGKYRPLVKRWLNQAQRQMVISGELHSNLADFAYTTTIGDNSYALPSNFGRLVDFFLIAEPREPINYVDVDDFDYLPRPAIGRPNLFNVRQDELFLYPTPDAAYSLNIRYRKIPADMSADSDVPEIPSQYHELLIAYAMKKAYLRENDYEAAGVWDAEWQSGLLKMRGEVQSDLFDQPQQVEGSYGPSRPYPEIHLP